MIRARIRGTGSLGGASMDIPRGDVPGIGQEIHAWGQAPRPPESRVGLDAWFGRWQVVAVTDAVAVGSVSTSEGRLVELNFQCESL